MRKADITPALVSELIRAQFPQWAGLPVEPVELDGWDNTTFRLGHELSVRLPSHERYVGQIEKEHRWLPVLAPQLPLPIPEPIARGEPGSGFPRPWSVYRWYEGKHATMDRIDDVAAFATELGSFLAALQRVDATDGPTPGLHSCERGAHVSVWDDYTRQAIDLLGSTIDAQAVQALWDEARATSWKGAPVWVHGDVTASNLLVADGRLSAVIDFGCSAVGDPACDLVMAWNFFEGPSRRAFAEQLDVDDDTWLRGRGWALWKALMGLRDLHAGPGGQDPAARFGWRGSSAEVIDAVLRD